MKIEESFDVLADADASKQAASQSALLLRHRAEVSNLVDPSVAEALDGTISKQR